MNKKTLLLLAIGFVISVIGISATMYIQSFKQVHFDIKQSDAKINIFKTASPSNQKVETLEKSGDLRLQTGDYIAVPEGEKYVPTAVGFVVNQDTSVTLNPAYTDSYQESIIAKERSAIVGLINTSYPATLTNYTIARGYIYEKEEWYATTLTQRMGGGEQGDIYRTVLKKEHGKWVIKAKPELILSASAHPDIPVEILRDINSK